VGKLVARIHLEDRRRWVRNAKVIMGMEDGRTWFRIFPHGGLISAALKLRVLPADVHSVHILFQKLVTVPEPLTVAARSKA
jgi:hypothetical protein